MREYHRERPVLFDFAFNPRHLSREEVEAEEAQDRSLQRAEALVSHKRRSKAAIRAERGEVSLTRLDYLQAAQHFQSAASLVAGGSESETWLSDSICQCPQNLLGDRWWQRYIQRYGARVSRVRGVTPTSTTHIPSLHGCAGLTKTILSPTSLTPGTRRTEDSRNRWVHSRPCVIYGIAVPGVFQTPLGSAAIQDEPANGKQVGNRTFSDGNQGGHGRRKSAIRAWEGCA